MIENCRVSVIVISFQLFFIFVIRLKSLKLLPIFKNEKCFKCNDYLHNSDKLLLSTNNFKIFSSPEESSVEPRKKSLASLLRKISSITDENNDNISSKSKKSIEIDGRLEDLPDEYSNFGKKKVKSIYKRRDQINVNVVGFGRLGVSVEVVQPSDNNKIGNEIARSTGLILNHEVLYWKDLNKRDLEIGDVISAYVENVRDDGKLDITIRPVGITQLIK